MSQFVDLARNLLTLEINTVLKTGMSAEKMPLAADALIDIAQDYYVFLCEQLDAFGCRRSRTLDGWAVDLSEGFGWGLAPFAAPAGAQDPTRYDPDFIGEDVPGETSARGTMAAVFIALRDVAGWLREMQDRCRDAAAEPGAPPLLVSTAAGIDRCAASILMRVQRNSDQIIDILHRRNLDGVECRRGLEEAARRMPALTTADMVILRKAWDVGTELVVLQSTIQIDGDVVTRVLKGRETAENGPLIDVHRNAVDVSFRYWSFLIETLGRVAGKAVHALAGDSG